MVTAPTPTGPGFPRELSSTERTNVPPAGSETAGRSPTSVDLRVYDVARPGRSWGQTDHRSRRQRQQWRRSRPPSRSRRPQALDECRERGYVPGREGSVIPRRGPGSGFQRRRLRTVLCPCPLCTFLASIHDISRCTDTATPATVTGGLGHLGVLTATSARWQSRSNCDCEIRMSPMLVVPGVGP